MRRLAAAVALILAATLTACAPTEDSGVLTPDSGPVAFYPKPSSGMDATLTGTIEMQDECFVLVDSAGDVHVPVFVAGQASWDGTALTIGDTAYRAGDELTVVGGEVSEQYLGPVTYYPAACDRTKAFFLAPKS